MRSKCAAREDVIIQEPREVLYRAEEKETTNINLGLAQDCWLAHIHHVCEALWSCKRRRLHSLLSRLITTAHKYQSYSLLHSESRPCADHQTIRLTPKLTYSLQMHAHKHKTFESCTFLYKGCVSLLQSHFFSLRTLPPRSTTYYLSHGTPRRAHLNDQDLTRSYDTILTRSV